MKKDTRCKAGSKGWVLLAKTTSLKCFKIQVSGLNAFPECGAKGRFEDTFNGVSSLSFQGGIVPPGYAFSGCPLDFLVINGVSRYPDYNAGSAPGTGIITEIPCPLGLASDGEEIIGLSDEKPDSQWAVGGRCGTKGIQVQRAGKTFCISSRSKQITGGEIIWCGGDECPEGQLKCESDRPPGFCCVPCDELINPLTAIKRQLKNG